MKKEEKIKEAYGRFYNPEKHHYSVNGWVNLNEWSENEVSEIIDEIKMEFRELSARPQSLEGIENNNGWIKIDDILELPNKYFECHFELEDGDIQIGAYVNHKNIFVGLDSQYMPFEIKAYKPIEEPKKRIY